MSKDVSLQGPLWAVGRTLPQGARPSIANVNAVGPMDQVKDIQSSSPCRHLAEPALLPSSNSTRTLEARRQRSHPHW